MSERIAYTCPGHSFYVSTIVRGYDIAALGGTVQGYETMAFTFPAAGREQRILYEYATQSERQARRAHYLISKRLSRLYGLPHRRVRQHSAPRFSDRLPVVGQTTQEKP